MKLEKYSQDVLGEWQRGVLNIIEIALKKFPEAKRIAVENFVMTSDFNKIADLANLTLDVVLYNWSADTGRAIIFCLDRLENQ